MTSRGVLASSSVNVSTTPAPPTIPTVQYPPSWSAQPVPSGGSVTLTPPSLIVAGGGSLASNVTVTVTVGGVGGSLLPPTGQPAGKTLTFTGTTDDAATFLSSLVYAAPVGVNGTAPVTVSMQPLDPSGTPAGSPVTATTAVRVVNLVPTPAPVGWGGSMQVPPVPGTTATLPPLAVGTTTGVAAPAGKNVTVVVRAPVGYNVSLAMPLPAGVFATEVDGVVTLTGTPAGIAATSLAVTSPTSAPPAGAAVTVSVGGVPSQAITLVAPGASVPVPALRKPVAAMNLTFGVPAPLGSAVGVSYPAGGGSRAVVAVVSVSNGGTVAVDPTRLPPGVTVVGSGPGDTTLRIEGPAAAVAQVVDSMSVLAAPGGEMFGATLSLSVSPASGGSAITTTVGLWPNVPAKVTAPPVVGVSAAPGAWGGVIVAQRGANVTLPPLAFSSAGTPSGTYTAVVVAYDGLGHPVQGVVNGGVISGSSPAEVAAALGRVTYTPSPNGTAAGLGSDVVLVAMVTDPLGRVVVANATVKTVDKPPPAPFLATSASATTLDNVYVLVPNTQPTAPVTVTVTAQGGGMFSVPGGPAGVTSATLTGTPGEVQAQLRGITAGPNVAAVVASMPGQSVTLPLSPAQRVGGGSSGWAAGAAVGPDGRVAVPPLGLLPAGGVYRVTLSTGDVFSGTPSEIDAALASLGRVLAPADGVMFATIEDPTGASRVVALHTAPSAGATWLRGGVAVAGMGPNGTTTSAVGSALKGVVATAALPVTLPPLAAFFPSGSTPATVTARVTVSGGVGAVAGYGPLYGVTDAAGGVMFSGSPDDVAATLAALVLHPSAAAATSGASGAINVDVSGAGSASVPVTVAPSPAAYTPLVGSGGTRVVAAVNTTGQRVKLPPFALGGGGLDPSALVRLVVGTGGLTAAGYPPGDVEFVGTLADAMAFAADLELEAQGGAFRVWLNATDARGFVSAFAIDLLLTPPCPTTLPPCVDVASWGGPGAAGRNLPSGVKVKVAGYDPWTNASRVTMRFAVTAPPDRDVSSFALGVCWAGPDLLTLIPPSNCPGYLPAGDPTDPLRVAQSSGRARLAMSTVLGKASAWDDGFGLVLRARSPADVAAGVWAYDVTAPASAAADAVAAATLGACLSVAGTPAPAGAAAYSKAGVYGYTWRGVRSFNVTAPGAVEAQVLFAVELADGRYVVDSLPGPAAASTAAAPAGATRGISWSGMVAPQPAGSTAVYAVNVAALGVPRTVVSTAVAVGGSGGGGTDAGVAAVVGPGVATCKPLDFALGMRMGSYDRVAFTTLPFSLTAKALNHSGVPAFFRVAAARADAQQMWSYVLRNAMPPRSALTGPVVVDDVARQAGALSGITLPALQCGNAKALTGGEAIVIPQADDEDQELDLTAPGVPSMGLLCYRAPTFHAPGYTEELAVVVVLPPDAILYRLGPQEFVLGADAQALNFDADAMGLAAAGYFASLVTVSPYANCSENVAPRAATAAVANLTRDPANILPHVDMTATAWVPPASPSLVGVTSLYLCFNGKMLGNVSVVVPVDPIGALPKGSTTAWWIIALIVAALVLCYILWGIILFLCWRRRRSRLYQCYPEDPATADVYPKMQPKEAFVDAPEIIVDGGGEDAPAEGAGRARERRPSVMADDDPRLMAPRAPFSSMGEDEDLVARLPLRREGLVVPVVHAPKIGWLRDERVQARIAAASKLAEQIDALEAEKEEMEAMKAKSQERLLKDLVTKLDDAQTRDANELDDLGGDDADRSAKLEERLAAREELIGALQEELDNGPSNDAARDRRLAALLGAEIDETTRAEDGDLKAMLEAERDAVRARREPNGAVPPEVEAALRAVVGDLEAAQDVDAEAVKRDSTDEEAIDRLAKREALLDALDDLLDPDAACARTVRQREDAVDKVLDADGALADANIHSAIVPALAPIAQLPLEVARQEIAAAVANHELAPSADAVRAALDKSRAADGKTLMQEALDVADARGDMEMAEALNQARAAALNRTAPGARRKRRGDDGGNDEGEDGDANLGNLAVRSPQEDIEALDDVEGGGEEPGVARRKRQASIAEETMAEAEKGVADVLRAVDVPSSVVDDADMRKLTKAAARLLNDVAEPEDGFVDAVCAVAAKHGQDLSDMTPAERHELALIAAPERKRRGAGEDGGDADENAGLSDLLGLRRDLDDLTPDELRAVQDAVDKRKRRHDGGGDDDDDGMLRDLSDLLGPRRLSQLTPEDVAALNDALKKGRKRRSGGDDDEGGDLDGVDLDGLLGLRGLPLDELTPAQLATVADKIRKRRADGEGDDGADGLLDDLSGLLGRRNLDELTGEELREMHDALKARRKHGGDKPSPDTEAAEVLAGRRVTDLDPSEFAELTNLAARTGRFGAAPAGATIVSDFAGAMAAQGVHGGAASVPAEVVAAVSDEFARRRKDRGGEGAKSATDALTGRHLDDLASEELAVVQDALDQRRRKHDKPITNDVDAELAGLLGGRDGLEELAPAELAAVQKKVDDAKQRKRRKGGDDDDDADGGPAGDLGDLLGLRRLDEMTPEELAAISDKLRARRRGGGKGGEEDDPLLADLEALLGGRRLDELNENEMGDLAAALAERRKLYGKHGGGDDAELVDEQAAHRLVQMFSGRAMGDLLPHERAALNRLVDNRRKWGGVGAGKSQAAKVAADVVAAVGSNRVDGLSGVELEDATRRLKERRSCADDKAGDLTATVAGRRLDDLTSEELRDVDAAMARRGMRPTGDGADGFVEDLRDVLKGQKLAEMDPEEVSGIADEIARRAAMRAAGEDAAALDAANLYAGGRPLGTLGEEVIVALDTAITRHRNGERMGGGADDALAALNQALSGRTALAARHAGDLGLVEAAARKLRHRKAARTGGMDDDAALPSELRGLFGGRDLGELDPDAVAELAEALADRRAARKRGEAPQDDVDGVLDGIDDVLAGRRLEDLTPEELAALAEELKRRRKRRGGGDDEDDGALPMDLRGLFDGRDLDQLDPEALADLAEAVAERRAARRRGEAPQDENDEALDLLDAVLGGRELTELSPEELKALAEELKRRRHKRRGGDDDDDDAGLSPDLSGLLGGRDLGDLDAAALAELDRALALHRRRAHRDGIPEDDGSVLGALAAELPAGQHLAGMSRAELARLQAALAARRRKGRGHDVADDDAALPWDIMAMLGGRDLGELTGEELARLDDALERRRRKRHGKGGDDDEDGGLLADLEALLGGRRLADLKPEELAALAAQLQKRRTARGPVGARAGAKRRDGDFDADYVDPAYAGALADLLAARPLEEMSPAELKRVAAEVRSELSRRHVPGEDPVDSYARDLAALLGGPSGVEELLRAPPDVLAELHAKLAKARRNARNLGDALGGTDDPLSTIAHWVDAQPDDMKSRGLGPASALPGTLGGVLDQAGRLTRQRAGPRLPGDGSGDTAAAVREALGNVLALPPATSEDGAARNERLRVALGTTAPPLESAHVAALSALGERPAVEAVVGVVEDARRAAASRGATLRADVYDPSALLAALASLGRLQDEALGGEAADVPPAVAEQLERRELVIDALQRLADGAGTGEPEARIAAATLAHDALQEEIGMAAPDVGAEDAAKLRAALETTRAAARSAVGAFLHANADKVRRHRARGGMSEDDDDEAGAGMNLLALQQLLDRLAHLDDPVAVRAAELVRRAIDRKMRKAPRTAEDEAEESELLGLLERLGSSSALKGDPLLAAALEEAQRALRRRRRHPAGDEDDHVGLGLDDTLAKLLAALQRLGDDGAEAAQAVELAAAVVASGADTTTKLRALRNAADAVRPLVDAGKVAPAVLSALEAHIGTLEGQQREQDAARAEHLMAALDTLGALQDADDARLASGLTGAEKAKVEKRMERREGAIDKLERAVDVLTGGAALDDAGAEAALDEAQLALNDELSRGALPPDAAATIVRGRDAAKEATQVRKGWDLARKLVPVGKGSKGSALANAFTDMAAKLRELRAKQDELAAAADDEELGAVVKRLHHDETHAIKSPTISPRLAPAPAPAEPAPAEPPAPAAPTATTRELELRTLMDHLEGMQEAAEAAFAGMTPEQQEQATEEIGAREDLLDALAAEAARVSGEQPALEPEAAVDEMSRLKELLERVQSSADGGAEGKKLRAAVAPTLRATNAALAAARTALRAAEIASGKPAPKPSAKKAAEAAAPKDAAPTVTVAPAPAAPGKPTLRELLERLANLADAVDGEISMEAPAADAGDERAAARNAARTDFLEAIVPAVDAPDDAPDAQLAGLLRPVTKPLRAMAAAKGMPPTTASQARQIASHLDTALADIAGLGGATALEDVGAPGGGAAAEPQTLGTAVAAVQEQMDAEAAADKAAEKTATAAQRAAAAHRSGLRSRLTDMLDAVQAPPPPRESQLARAARHAKRRGDLEGVAADPGVSSDLGRRLRDVLARLAEGDDAKAEAAAATAAALAEKRRAAAAAQRHVPECPPMLAEPREPDAAAEKALRTVADGLEAAQAADEALVTSGKGDDAVEARMRDRDELLDLLVDAADRASGAAAPVPPAHVLERAVALVQQPKLVGARAMAKAAVPGVVKALRAEMGAAARASPGEKARLEELRAALAEVEGLLREKADASSNSALPAHVRMEAGRAAAAAAPVVEALQLQQRVAQRGGTLPRDLARRHAEDTLALAQLRQVPPKLVGTLRALAAGMDSDAQRLAEEGKRRAGELRALLARLAEEQQAESLRVPLLPQPARGEAMRRVEDRNAAKALLEGEVAEAEGGRGVAPLVTAPAMQESMARKEKLAALASAVAAAAEGDALADALVRARDAAAADSRNLNVVVSAFPPPGEAEEATGGLPASNAARIALAAPEACLQPAAVTAVQVAEESREARLRGLLAKLEGFQEADSAQASKGNVAAEHRVERRADVMDTLEDLVETSSRMQQVPMGVGDFGGRVAEERQLMRGLAALGTLPGVSRDEQAVIQMETRASAATARGCNDERTAVDAARSVADERRRHVADLLAAQPRPRRASLAAARDTLVQGLRMPLTGRDDAALAQEAELLKAERLLHASDPMVAKVLDGALAVVKGALMRARADTALKTAEVEAAEQLFDVVTQDITALADDLPAKADALELLDAERKVLGETPLPDQVVDAIGQKDALIAVLEELDGVISDEARGRLRALSRRLAREVDKLTLELPAAEQAAIVPASVAGLTAQAERTLAILDSAPEGVAGADAEALRGMLSKELAARAAFDDDAVRPAVLVQQLPHCQALSEATDAPDDLRRAAAARATALESLGADVKDETAARESRLAEVANAMQAADAADSEKRLRMIPGSKERLAVQERMAARTELMGLVDALRSGAGTAAQATRAATLVADLLARLPAGGRERPALEAIGADLKVLTAMLPAGAAVAPRVVFKETSVAPPHAPEKRRQSLFTDIDAPLRASTPEKAPAPAPAPAPTAAALRRPQSARGFFDDDDDDDRPAAAAAAAASPGNFASMEEDEAEEASPKRTLLGGIAQRQRQAKLLGDSASTGAPTPKAGSKPAVAGFGDDDDDDDAGFAVRPAVAAGFGDDDEDDDARPGEALAREGRRRSSVYDAAGGAADDGESGSEEGSVAAAARRFSVQQDERDAVPQMGMGGDGKDDFFRQLQHEGAAAGADAMEISRSGVDDEDRAAAAARRGMMQRAAAAMQRVRAPAAAAPTEGKTREALDAVRERAYLAAMAADGTKVPKERRKSRDDDVRKEHRRDRGDHERDRGDHERDRDREHKKDREREKEREKEKERKERDKEREDKDRRKDRDDRKERKRDGERGEKEKSRDKDRDGDRGGKSKERDGDREEKRDKDRKKDKDRKR